MRKNVLGASRRSFKPFAFEPQHLKITCLRINRSNTTELASVIRNNLACVLHCSVHQKFSTEHGIYKQPFANVSVVRENE